MQDSGAVGEINQDLTSENGLSINGLSINGLSINGLSINGLSINGLSINGLSTSTFSTWFNQSIGMTPVVMGYIVKCALPTGRSLAWTNPSTGAAYSWPGNLGLAPAWAGGQPPTTTEQQLITACLAAHANKYGLHVPISVEGLDSSGVPIPLAPGELTTYSVREGCFFGNLFTGQGIFAGSADPSYRAANSSPRACALQAASTTDDTAPCPPIQDIDTCAQHCQIDKTNTYYTSCSFGGNTYQPLTTRILPVDLYRCGDGVCQFTEGCGTGNVASSCKKDCGTCPSAS